MNQTPRGAPTSPYGGRVARLWGLPRAEKRFAMLAAVVAGPVLWVLGRRGFTGTLEAIDAVARKRTGIGGEAAVRPTRAEVITRRVLTGLRQSAGCLPVALVQYATHRARAEHVAFVIGVRKGRSLDLAAAADAFDLDAHAWVEDDGDLGGGTGYEPIFRFEDPHHRYGQMPRSRP